MISLFTFSDGVCKPLCLKEIKVEFLIYPFTCGSLCSTKTGHQNHDPFTLIFPGNSFFC